MDGTAALNLLTTDRILSAICIVDEWMEAIRSVLVRRVERIGVLGELMTSDLRIG